MPPIITCVAALNPCFNVHGVEFLIESISMDLEFFDDGYATKAKKWFTYSLEGLYNIYYTKYGNPTITTESSSGASSSRASGRNQMTRLLTRLKEHKNKKARSDPSLSSEYERYVHLDFVTHLQTTEFAAFDVLASESAFSTSGRVLSIRRTRLTPASLEMCMCLKDHLDTQEQNEAIPLSDEEIALDAASSEGSMSGPGLGGEEGDYGYDMTNYHDDY
ncbi:zinc finger BED domain-containing protein RICESLEEPER 2-like protein [Tanacetum coccineum]